MDERPNRYTVTVQLAAPNGVATYTYTAETWEEAQQLIKPYLPEYKFSDDVAAHTITIRNLEEGTKWSTP